MSTVLRVQDAGAPEDQARRLGAGMTGSDRLFAFGARAVGATVLVITGGVGVFLGSRRCPPCERYGWSLLHRDALAARGRRARHRAPCWWALSQVALVAMSVAFPLALLTALYISEYAPARIKADAGLAGRPDGGGAAHHLRSLGLLPDQPHASRAGACGCTSNLGWIPIFDVRTPTRTRPCAGAVALHGVSMFVAGIAVAMMVLPMACAVMRQVFSQAPPGEREAALALGATRWGMVRTVVLPFGRGGIIGGTMLGLGRALGETIAVLLIISPAFEIKPRILEIGTQHRLGADRRPVR